MEEKIGKVTHYYTDIDVAVIKLEDKLEIGDTIKFEGHTTNFKQQVKSMEIEHEEVEVGKSGQSVGLMVKNRVRTGDHVYKVS